MRLMVNTHFEQDCRLNPKDMKSKWRRLRRKSENWKERKRFFGALSSYKFSFGRLLYPRKLRKAKRIDVFISAHNSRRLLCSFFDYSLRQRLPFVLSLVQGYSQASNARWLWGRITSQDQPQGRLLRNEKYSVFRNLDDPLKGGC